MKRSLTWVSQTHTQIEKNRKKIEKKNLSVTVSGVCVHMMGETIKMK